MSCTLAGPAGSAPCLQHGEGMCMACTWRAKVGLALSHADVTTLFGAMGKGGDRLDYAALDALMREGQQSVVSGQWSVASARQ